MLAALTWWLGRTPNRTFVLYPLLVILEHAGARRGQVRPDLRFVPLLVWGYLQYRTVGRYRVAHGAGGPGITVPPQALVQDGPYRLTRNPMYLGHLIFLLGLILTFRSRLALVLLLANLAWFQRRVVEDEERLVNLFGAAYDDYRARVKRWIPGVI